MWYFIIIYVFIVIVIVLAIAVHYDSIVIVVFWTIYKVIEDGLKNLHIFELSVVFFLLF